MDSMIKETNENLKTIIEGLKNTLDASIDTLDNIQIQMDKKVEEAKKYKIQVDAAKDRINFLEEENKSFELSLKELSEKYSKMNLVSIIEAGNKEIKAKINDNLSEINKQKEHIADLTNKARTIKDLLINLKKDKTIKEERLENIKVAYEYYNDRITEVIDYAFNHANNLMDYKDYNSFDNANESEYVSDNTELENTMVFDEIAKIDDNKNFKDEMSFISDQIDNSLNDLNKDNKEKIEDIINNGINKYDFETKEDTGNIFEEQNDDSTDSNKDLVFDKIEEPLVNLSDVEEKHNEESNLINSNIEVNDKESDNLVQIDNNTDIDTNNEETDDDSADRINKINDLFSSLNDVNKDIDINNNIPNDIENKIDNVYLDVFGKPLEDNVKDPTLMDIFGNPIKEENLNSNVSKSLEELLTENGIDYRKFKEDEQNYLKEIYDEDKFTKIINVLKRNNINLDNIYNSFNIFGEISPNELENLLSKLINAGQSVEAIGLILEKLPKVKKYNLDEAIISYGDYIKDIDITELVMKAKELYENGGNK